MRKVRNVLYDRDRLRRLRTELSSIEILMNFNPGIAIGPNDVRVEPGAGPNWFIPATGKVSPGVAEAADRCDRIARQLMSTRRRIGELDIDGADKRNLRQGFKHLANAWQERGALWRQPGAGDRAMTNRIIAEEKDAYRDFKKVKEYFRL